MKQYLVAIISIFLVTNAYCNSSRNENSCQCNQIEGISAINENQEENLFLPKIIHISDTHVGAKKCIDMVHKNFHKSCEKNFSEIVDNLILWSKRNDPQKYIVVITGDIVDSPKKSYIKKALKLINKLKYIDSEKQQKRFLDVLVIPGNHDYIIPKLKKNYLNKNLVCTDTIYNFRSTYYGSSYKNKTFPKIDIINNILFIGMDFMDVAYPKSGDCIYMKKEKIKISKKQLCCLQNILSKSNKKYNKYKDVVIYIHYVPQQLIKAIKDYKDKNFTILYGHGHGAKTILSSEYLLNNAASSTGVKNFMDEIMIIDLENKKISPIKWHKTSEISEQL